MTNHPIAEQDSLEALIAKLRAKCRHMVPNMPGYYGDKVLINPDGPEAADTLSQMRDALVEARGAIASLAEDALGMVVVTPASFDDEGFEYPIRDELLSRIDAALTTTKIEKE